MTNTTQQILAQEPTWVTLSEEDSEDLDEPPEIDRNITPAAFNRTTIRPSNDKSSLLTRAILGQPDDETYEDESVLTKVPTRRRRSMISNVSVASTADLTSDTGFTSPARTGTPSPPIPELNMLRLDARLGSSPSKNATISTLGPAPTTNPLVSAIGEKAAQPTEQAAPRKRCIQFACGKPLVQDKAAHGSQQMEKTPSAQEAARPSRIKFACPARPASTQNTPPQRGQAKLRARSPAVNPRSSPSTPKRTSALSAALLDVANQPSQRRLSNKTGAVRPKFLRANSKDLVKDSSQFHEFASGISREDDWIRQGNEAVRKLTIYDTLTKENLIRKLAAEAEEEAELEDEAEEAAIDEDDEEDVDGDEDDDEEIEENVVDDDDEDEVDLEGYYTDEETGFASSDDEEDEDEDENMILWTPSSKALREPDTNTPTMRRPSAMEQLSDSSTAPSNASVHRSKAQRVLPRSSTPDLPDSTDFVCGTLDEDRPLEEAYLTSIAARRNGKLRVIPQDIDPSFPASEPEEEGDEEIYNPVHHSSDEENVWMQGRMDDLHHENGRSRRRRKSEHASPRKFKSPPPKRRHSPPPPKARYRSPRPLFTRPSPQTIQPQACPKLIMTSPSGTPRQGGNLNFDLAGRTGLTDAKSLPRPPALLTHLRNGRYLKADQDDDLHVRGAIDIVKGLERKRQRRKEKFHQKYCSRARRRQVPERKQKPGLGAERMKELGLLMAGKKDQGNYVMSI